MAHIDGCARVEGAARSIGVEAFTPTLTLHRLRGREQMPFYVGNETDEPMWTRPYFYDL